LITIHQNAWLHRGLEFKYLLPKEPRILWKGQLSTCQHHNYRYQP